MSSWSINQGSGGCSGKLSKFRLVRLVSESVDTQPSPPSAALLRRMLIGVDSSESTTVFRPRIALSVWKSQDPTQRFIHDGAVVVREQGAQGGASAP